jgi:hypothetical protein
VAVTVRVEVPPEFHQRPAEVELVVTPVAGAGEFPPAVRRLLAGASPWEGRLRPGFTYRVEVSAPATGVTTSSTSAGRWWNSGGTSTRTVTATAAAIAGRHKPSAPMITHTIMT